MVETGIIKTRTDVRVVRQRGGKLWFHGYAWDVKGHGVGCLDLATQGVLWEEVFPHQRAEENWPARRIACHSGSLWLDDLAAHLFHIDTHGVEARICARDPLTGAVQWSRDVPLPPPAHFTESEQAGQLPTEELDAFFMATSGQPVLALNRTSRRSQGYDISMTPEQAERGKVLPPNTGQLELTGLDAVTGAVRFERSIDSGVVPGPAREEFSGLLYSRNGLAQLNEDSGAFDWEVELPSWDCWPIRSAAGFLIAWRERGGCTVAEVDPQAGIVRQRRHKQRGVKRILLHDTQKPILQINDQFVLPLDDQLAPTWQARCKPWIYCLDRVDDQPMAVGTAGRGGYLYLLDAGTGAELLCDKDATVNLQRIDDETLLAPNRVIFPKRGLIERFETDRPYSPKLAYHSRTTYYHGGEKSGLHWVRV